jgi:hypothetical protein
MNERENCDDCNGQKANNTCKCGAGLCLFCMSDHVCSAINDSLMPMFVEFSFKKRYNKRGYSRSYSMLKDTLNKLLLHRIQKTFSAVVKASKTEIIRLYNNTTLEFPVVTVLLSRGIEDTYNTKKCKVTCSVFSLSGVRIFANHVGCNLPHIKCDTAITVVVISQYKEVCVEYVESIDALSNVVNGVKDVKDLNGPIGDNCAVKPNTQTYVNLDLNIDILD